MMCTGRLTYGRQSWAIALYKCDQIWRSLVKLKKFWANFYGIIFIFVQIVSIGICQILKNNLAIWSHCQVPRSQSFKSPIRTIRYRLCTRIIFKQRERKTRQTHCA